jgi:hypothetical protein
LFYFLAAATKISRRDNISIQNINIAKTLIVMRSFFSNFTARLMIIHFIAFCLFIWAFETLGFLHDYDFLFSVAQHINRVTFRDQFNADLEFVVQAGNIGLLIAYVLSWIVSNKRNWHWINSVVIFVLAFLLKNFLLRSFLDKTFLTPGGPFKIYSISGHLLLGIALIALGSLLIFFKGIVLFIDRAEKKGKKSPATSSAKRN